MLAQVAADRTGSCATIHLKGFSSASVHKDCSHEGAIEPT